MIILNKLLFDNKANVSNYRPISTLLSAKKIFEKLTYQRIVRFVNKYFLILNYQFGFKKNSSTFDSIFEVLQFCILDAKFLTSKKNNKTNA